MSNQELELDQQRIAIVTSMLAEYADKLHSDFIQLEDDTQYDAQSRPRPNYSMTDWDRLERRLRILAERLRKA